MVQKKVPMRTCIACRQEKPKKELIRIVKKPDGTFGVDRVGKVSGRGAYLCDDKAFMEKIVKKKLLKHSFGVDVPDSVYEELQGEFFEKL